jgi:hypothetical protein
MAEGALPAACDLSQLGLPPGAVRQAVVLRTSASHSVHRLVCAGGSYVLKCFHASASPLELRIYALLEQSGVPVLPVHGLLIASRRKPFPGWALPLISTVTSGQFEASLSEAIAPMPSLPASEH